MTGSVGLAFAVTLLLMLALRPLAAAIGLIDIPGGRKAHDGQVPIIGGLAVFGGLLFGWIVSSHLMDLGLLLLAGGLLALVGALDDRFDLPAGVRLLAQTCAALVMIFGAGLQVASLGDAFFLGAVLLGPLAWPFTVLVTLTVINAFNMSDGMDGLAGGSALVSLLLLAFVAQGNPIQFEAILVLCASVFAFLIFNVPARVNRRFRVFMGDAGSTLLGFSIAWLCIVLTQGTQPAITPVTALWIVAIPLFELFSSMIRRIVNGRSPFEADAEHFHHVLLRAGFSQLHALAIMLGSALLLGIVGVAGYYAGVSEGIMLIGLIAVGVAHYLLIRRAWIVVHWLRRSEVGTQTS